MGKNLIQQKRGKGSPRYRAVSFHSKGKTKLARMSAEAVEGKITDILHCSHHSGPLMEVSYANGETTLLQAPEGIRVGEKLQMGDDVDVKTGNVAPLKDIPEGTAIYNIESHPGDGGKFVRSSGGAARIITKVEQGVVVELPSNKRKTFQPECRAVIGLIAGSGRKDKPFLKAGKKHFAKKAKNKLYPKVCGTSMNAVDHPFGGSSSATKGRPTQSPRNAPPGRKVGKLAPRRTGRRKK